MRTIDWYLFGIFFRTGALLTVVISMIIVFGKFADTLNHRSHHAVGDALYESLVQAPTTLQFAVPFIAFLAGAIGIYRLLRASEWTILTQTGLRGTRFLAMAAVAGFIIGAVYSFALNPLSLKFNSSGTSEGSEVTDHVMRLHDAIGTTYVFARRVSASGDVLSGVTILRFSNDIGYRYRVQATEMRWSDGVWRVPPESRWFGKPRRHTSGEFDFSATPREVSLRLGSRFDRSIFGLPSHIRNLRSIGVNTLKLDVQFHRLLSLPFISAVLTMIGGVIVVRFWRRWPRVGVVILILAVGFAFFVASTILDTLGRLGGIDPAIAMWSLPFVAFGLYWTLEL